VHVFSETLEKGFSPRGGAQARRLTREDLLAGILCFRARDYLEQAAAVQQLPDLLARHPKVRARVRARPLRSAPFRPGPRLSGRPRLSRTPEAVVLPGRAV
jgi:hypothetical protein